MSRVVDAQLNFYQNESSQLPVKWAAPESLKYGQFSSKSDVWSFGICLWELFSKGETPYFTMTNQETITQVANGLNSFTVSVNKIGYRLPIPANCPEAAYKLMLKCWNENVNERPSFLGVMQEIQSWIRKETIVMTDFVVDKSIYN